MKATCLINSDFGDLGAMHAAFGKTSFLFYLNYTETTFCAHKKGLAEEKDGIGTE